MTVGQDAHVRLWNTRTFQEVPVKVLQVISDHTHRHVITV